MLILTQVYISLIISNVSFKSLINDSNIEHNIYIMQSKFLIGIIISLLALIQIGNAATDSLFSTVNDTTRIYKINIKQEIGPPTWRHLQVGFEEAERLNSDIILLHMNTYGGLVDAADSMRTKILNSETPVWVYIDNNAASAGALISIACDRIYMRPGSNIGAATVVNQTGEVVPDKFQSFMRSMMRSTAESHGKDTIINGNDTTYQWKRDPAIAEAMVDPSIYVPQISDTGKVLTFTTQEAIKYGFCEGEAKNIDELMKLAQIENYIIDEYVPDTTERMIDFLISPVVSGILIMLILGGIYFELQSPGVGFPSAAAIVAAILYFAPLYLQGLAENWEIILFVIGIVLIAVEIFAIPGFGIAGISGIILMIVGLTLSMVEALDFEYGIPDFSPVLESLTVVLLSFFLSIIMSIWLTKRLLTSEAKIFDAFVLKADQKLSDGYVGVDTHYASIIGKQGLAHSVLRPSGKVIVDGELFDAVSLYNFVNKGDKIEVVRFEAGQLYIRRIEE